MNINENIRNERKIVEKIKRCTYKISNISAADYPRVPNLALYQCLDIVIIPYGGIGKISNLNIHYF